MVLATRVELGLAQDIEVELDDNYGKEDKGM